MFDGDKIRMNLYNNTVLYERSRTVLDGRKCNVRYGEILIQMFCHILQLFLIFINTDFVSHQNDNLAYLFKRVGIIHSGIRKLQKKAWRKCLNFLFVQRRFAFQHMTFIKTRQWPLVIIYLRYMYLCSNQTIRSSQLCLPLRSQWWLVKFVWWPSYWSFWPPTRKKKKKKELIKAVCLLPSRKKMSFWY